MQQATPEPIDYIFAKIYPLIKDCHTPQEAEQAVRAWARVVHPRDGFMGLVLIGMITRSVNAPKDWEYFQSQGKDWSAK